MVVTIPLLLSHIPANAKLRPDGEYDALDSEPPAKGPRLVRAGALYHPMMGAPVRTAWPHVWQQPARQYVTKGCKPTRTMTALLETREGDWEKVEFFWPEATEEEKAIKSAVRSTCTMAVDVRVGIAQTPHLPTHPRQCRSSSRDVLAQVNRPGMRSKDGAAGTMVGAGRHFSFEGINEAYKPDAVKLKRCDRKRKRGTSDDMASQLEMAKGAWDIFKGTCPSHSRIFSTA